MNNTLPNIECDDIGLISEETTVAILERYIAIHGPSTEELSAAVLQSAQATATALACFQMVMRGDVRPEITPNGLVYRSSKRPSRGFEPIGSVVRQVLAEVGR